MSNTCSDQERTLEMIFTASMTIIVSMWIA